MAKLHHINQNIKKENYIAAIPFVNQCLENSNCFGDTLYKL